MLNIANVMREEITRLPRRASCKELDAMKKASAQHRRHIAALKREVAQLARQFSLLSRKLPGAPVATANGSDGKQVRFVAKGLRSHRERLGVSANELFLAVILPFLDNANPALKLIDLPRQHPE
jgi:hypothetical protein